MSEKLAQLKKKGGSKNPLIFALSYGQYITAVSNEGGMAANNNTVTLNGVTFTWLSNQSMKASVAGTWTYPASASATTTAHFEAGQAFTAGVAGYTRIFIAD